MSSLWGFFRKIRIVVGLFERMVGVFDFRKGRNTREKLLDGPILRDEDEVVEYLSEWIRNWDYYSVFTESGFKVTNGHRRKPDMVIENKKTKKFSAIEVKKSKPSEVFKASKIVNYAKDFCNGAKYIIDGIERSIKNFLVATELSPFGLLIEDDVPLNENDQKKKAERYKEYIRRYGKNGKNIEPYVEWQRTYDFVRNDIWKQWKDRIGMEDLSIGILLSTKNDFAKSSQLTLEGSPLQSHKPKMFVTHFSKEKWGSWWREI